MAKTPNTPAKILALLLIPVLLYLAYVAGSRGLADMYARPVISQLGKWERGGLRLSQEQWQEAEATLDKALALDPNNPNLHLWMGLALEGPYRSYLTDELAGNAARKLAAEHYRHSIQLQPTWPYAWADLASVKYRNGEIDEELFEAIQTAITLGPNEPPVISRLTRMGIVLWSDVPEQYQSAVLTAMTNSLKHGRRGYALDTLRLLNRTGTIRKISPLAGDEIIAAVLRFLDNANPALVREMLMVLQKNELWSSLTDSDKTLLQANLDRVMSNANAGYMQSVEEILVGSGISVRSEE